MRLAVGPTQQVEASMQKLVQIAGVTALSMLVAASGEATTARELSTEAMTAEATAIVSGRCTSIRTVWSGRVLVTMATIQVNDRLKGDAAETITVALPGGIDANRRFPVSMLYPGAPQIATGEDVFLFLAPNAAVGGSLAIVGFSQGKFSIVNDERGEKVVSRNLSTISVQSPAGTRRGTSARVPLDQFRNEIRRYLGQR
jgi:hypothetical protein